MSLDNTQETGKVRATLSAVFDAAALARLEQFKTESTFAALVKQAEAAVQSAQTALNDTELRVPFARISDAVPGPKLQGAVESIGAVAQLKGGDVTYPVKIKLIDTDARLRWGMTAAVDFSQE